MGEQYQPTWPSRILPPHLLLLHTKNKCYVYVILIFMSEWLRWICDYVTFGVDTAVATSSFVLWHVIKSCTWAVKGETVYAIVWKLYHWKYPDWIMVLVCRQCQADFGMAGMKDGSKWFQLQLHITCPVWIHNRHHSPWIQEVAKNCLKIDMVGVWAVSVPRWFWMKEWIKIC